MKTNTLLRLTLLLIGMLWATYPLNAQSTDQNYIRSTTCKDSVLSQTDIQYYDGLGRESELLQLKASPTGQHAVFLQEYDGIGREARKWLPYLVIPYTGDFVSPDMIKSKMADLYEDKKPYSFTEYEPSPLNRPSMQYGPGSEWQDNWKGVSTEYFASNAYSDFHNCKYYKVENFVNDTIVHLSCLPVSSSKVFNLSSQRGEGGERTLYFTNGRGQNTLIRQAIATVYYDTYYVYDDYGNLCAVLPPLASDGLDAALAADGRDTSLDSDTPDAVANRTDAVNNILYKYAYLYKFDARNRCVAKKLPGCEWVYYIYDGADRLIFTQDGVQRGRGEWMFSIPDAEGRVCLKGVCGNALNVWGNPLKGTVVTVVKERGGTTEGAGALDSPDSLQAVNNSQSSGSLSGSGYSVLGVFLSSPVLLEANYYDDYSFLDAPLLSWHKDSLRAEESVTGFTPVASSVPHGLLTGSVSMHLGDKDDARGAYHSAVEPSRPAIEPSRSAVEPYTSFVNYYDSFERIVQTKSLNHLGGYDMSCFSYNLAGELLAEKRVHQVAPDGEKPAEQLTEQLTHTYDLMGRLLTTSCQLGTSAPFLLTDNVYDKFGHLQKSKRNGVPSLSTEYNYNIRSWLSELSGPLFRQSLHYTDGAGVHCYNGNISSMTWQCGEKQPERGYKFNYDILNRVTNAQYGEGSNLSDNAGRYNEQVTAYDKQGNVLGLLRHGQTSATGYGLIDDLSFTLNGNQLLSVNDASSSSVYGNGFEFKDGSRLPSEYSYDANGNLIEDLNKKISSIRYNCLNLPCRIEFADGNSISYLYASDGTKLRTAYQTENDTTVTDYCGNVIYENGVPRTLLTESGYVSLSDGKHHYFIQDHQGNNRVVADESGTVEEVNDYYPFGGLMSSSTRSVQPYKYNGKELDRKNGLDWYDYGARQYDATIGRWNAVDPMAEKYYASSPYNYCQNNPVRLIDPDGKAAQIPPFLWGTANPLITAGSRMTMLGTADKVVRVLPKESHHILPRSLRKHDVVKAARDAGFKLDGKENRINVEKFNRATGKGQHGKHPDYTNQLRKQLDKFKRDHPNASPEQSAKFVREQVSNARNIIENNPGTKINDLELKGLTLPTDAIKPTKPLEEIKPLKYINPGIV